MGGCPRFCGAVIWYVICCPAGSASRRHSRHDRRFWLGCDPERDRLFMQRASQNTRISHLAGTAPTGAYTERFLTSNGTGTTV